MIHQSQSGKCVEFMYSIFSLHVTYVDIYSYVQMYVARVNLLYLLWQLV